MTVEFGPSRSKRFRKAVEEAQSGAGECSELEPGSYRVRFVLSSDGRVYTSLARLLERVRNWRATEVYEGNQIVSSYHARDIRVSGCPRIARQPPLSHEPPDRRFNRGQAAVLCAAVAARIRPRAPRCGSFWSRGSARQRSGHAGRRSRNDGAARERRRHRGNHGRRGRARGGGRPVGQGLPRSEDRSGGVDCSRSLRGANGSASRSRGLRPRWLGSAGWSGC